MFGAASMTNMLSSKLHDSGDNYLETRRTQITRVRQLIPDFATFAPSPSI
jgi:hypothetical protein